MAKNPFDQFDAPAANPFDQFDPVAVAEPPAAKAPAAAAAPTSFIDTVKNSALGQMVADAFTPKPQSVMGDLPPAPVAPTGLNGFYEFDLAKRLETMTPAQRQELMSKGDLEARVAQSLLTDAAKIAETQDVPQRLRRQKFAKENPKTGALGAGSASVLRNTLNIPTVAADFVNQNLVNPVGDALGIGTIPRMDLMPGSQFLTDAASDYMPNVAKQSLADALKRDQFADWFTTNLVAQTPQVAQSVLMAMNPATRALGLPIMGAQEAADAYAQGDNSNIAAAKGTVAALAEMLPLKVFDSVRARVLALPANAQISLMQDAARRVAAAGIALTAESLVGGIEESLTELGKNAIDNVFAGKNVPMLRNVPEAGVIGAGAGGIMSTPNVVTALAQGDNSPQAQLARSLNAGAANFAAQDTTQDAANEFSRPQARQEANPFDQFDPQPQNELKPQSPSATQAPQPDSRGRIEPTLGEPTDNVPTRPEPTLGEPAPTTSAAPPVALPAEQPAEQPVAASAVPAANTTRVSTASGRQIDVEYQVVEASQLQAASGDLQPRDRSRDSSDAQIAQIAGTLDPQRLGVSAEADRGAPIVGDDNIIESGNGRVKAIVRAYSEVPERGRAYRDFLVQNGYPQAQNMSQPVLIRRRVTPLDAQARRQFVIEANESATMSLSASEQAMADAKKLGGDILEALQGQDIKSAANRDFVRMFIGRVVSPSQANAMTDPDGGLSVDGLRRIQAALIAKAYDNADILVQLVESMDMESKSIGTAFLQAAPDFAKLKQEVADGLVKPEMDVTPQLIEAAQLTIRLRDQRIKPEEYFKQQGMFDSIDPLVQEWVRNFYNNKNRAAAADKIADILRSYVDMARQQLVGQQSLMGDEPTPIELVKAARQRVNEPTASLFGESDGVEQPSPQADGGSVPKGRKQVQRRAVPAERTESGTERRGVDAGSGQGNRQDQAEKARGEVDGTERSVRQESDRAGDEDTSPAANQSTRGISNTNLTEKVSFTDRQSLFRDAFRAAGLDPDTAETLPPQEQFRILSRLLKETYNLPVLEMTERMNLRLAIDQLLDAYRNLQYMVHVLDLPQSAIGLNGSLGLVLRDQLEYRGAFYPGGTNNVEGVVTQTPTIVLPRRSNSFAHEWGHAFDFWVMGLYNQKNYASQLIRAVGSSEAGMDATLGGAFANLMNTIFFDQAAQSAEILELERQLTVARSDKRKKELTEKLKQMREGASKSVNSRSRFYRSSQQLGNPGYYLMPAEMLARSFEAYISHKVEMAGGTTEFIGKGDKAYLNDIDQYMKLAFPKADERLNVFAAYDQLFDVVREKALLNQLNEAGADKPTGEDTIDPLRYFRVAENNAPKGLKGLLAKEREAIAQDLRYARRMAERPSDGKTRMERFRHRVRDVAFSNRGVLFQIRRRYQGNDRALRALNDIIKRIATDPGRNSGATFNGGVFDEAVEREINKYGIQLANIVKNHGIQDFTEGELQLLRKVLTMMEDEEVKAPPYLTQAAAALRRLMNDTFYYLRAAGVDVGYVRQGYLTRILDEAAVFGDQPGFVKDATELYKLMFEREVPAFADSEAEDFRDIAAELSRRYQRVVVLKKRQEEMNLPKFKKAQEFAEFRAVMDQVNKLLSKIKKAEADGDQDTIDELNAKLSELVDENIDVLDEARDLIRDLWSDAAANEWAFRIQHGKFNSWESHSPAGHFLKQRTLPPEADRIINKWYLQDPIETIETYLTGAVRKAEYNRRFGINQFRKADPAFKSLESMLEELSRGGIQKDDVDQVKAIIHQVTGQSPSEMPSGLRWLSSAVQGIGSMVLLGRVAATSLAEPIAVAIQTGNSADALRSIVLTLQEILPTASVRERRILSDVLGINGSLDWSDIVTNRLGGVFEGDPKLARLSNRFFRRVGLTGLTRAQRRTAMAIGIRYFAELGRDIKDNTKNARFARDELIDFGLDPTQLKDFAEYVSQFTERLPTPEEVQSTDLGAQLSVLTMRLVNQSIQNPKAIDRPWAANTAPGRMTYGLLSFNLAFYRNAMAKSYNKVMREKEAGGNMAAGQALLSQVAAPFAALYFGHLLVTIAREVLLNPAKLEEERKKKRLEAYLLQLALTRSGFTGLLDVPFNALTSVKYERDMSNLFVGAVPAYVGQSLDKIVKFFVKNSPNTNTGEFNGIRGLYELLAVPMLAYGTAALPGGAVLGAGYGLVNAWASSPKAKDKVAEALVGKKQTKKDD